MRQPIPDFMLNNSFYAGMQVTVWRVDVNTLQASATMATLYADLYGTRTLINPQTLDSLGRWPRIPYTDDSVIMEIAGTGAVATHLTGVIPRLGYARGAWVTATEYWPGDTVTQGANADIYQCQQAHTSGVFATNLTAGYWIKMVDVAGIKTAVVAELTLSGVGIAEAPVDATPYSRQSAAWVSAPTKAQVDALAAAIGAAVGAVTFIGTYNATAHTADYTVISGYTDGVLVAASAATNKYLIVTVAGTGIAPAPVVALVPGDYLISDGSAWNKVGLGGAAVAANTVSITAIATIAATEVQGALAEISGDVTAETTARGVAVSAEAATRGAADTAEATTRGTADTTLAAAIVTAQAAAQTYTDAAFTAFASPNDGLAYARRTNAGVGGWVETIRRRVRTISATSDTPTLNNDSDAVLVCTSGSAVTITANDLGTDISYGVQQAGAGQVTIAAGGGVTLISDKATPSYQTARKGARLTVTCRGDGTVIVEGNTA